MSLRARLFVIITLVVLLVLGVSLLLIISAKKKAAEQQTATTTAPAGNIIEKNNFNSVQLQPITTSVPNGMPVKQLTTVEIEQNAVKQLAKIFAERYGTYSTDSNFQNIKDVQDLVTQSLWSKLKVKITTAPAASFVGATAKVITADLSNWGNNKAEVQLRAVVVKQQNGTQTSLTQNVDVSMVKNGSDWLVNDFTWR